MRSKLGSINRLVAAMLALVWACAGVAGLVVAYIYGAWVAAVAAVFALWYAALCDSMLMIIKRRDPQLDARLSLCICRRHG